MYASIPFPDGGPSKPLPRRMRDAPLLVRHPCPDVYSLEARQRILDAAGVPREFHDPEKTKVCVVSFGGQVIKKPHSRNGSRNLSISNTPLARPVDLASLLVVEDSKGLLLPPPLTSSHGSEDVLSSSSSDVGDSSPGEAFGHRADTPPHLKLEKLRVSLNDLPRLASPSHIYIPGAPPA